MADQSTPPLRGYLEVLGRHRWLVLIIVILTPLTAFLISRAQQQSYQASADVLTDRFSFAPGAAGDATDAERAAATKEKLARIPAVAQRVVDSAQVDLTPTEFLDRSSVSATSGADLLTFTVRDPDPDRATALATAYAQVFTQYRQELGSSTIAEARSNLERRMAKLASSGKRDTALYRGLAASDQQLAAFQALPEQGSVVVQPAVDATQVAPRTIRNLVLGLGLGLLLAVGAAFLAEALDTRVRTGDEVSRILDVPILGEVPAARSPRRTQLVTVADPAAPAAEGIRMLRASFDFARKESGIRSVMFSNLRDRDRERDAAMTVGELAVALARAGRHVVLGDFDSRSSTLAKLFDVDGRAGVTDVVAGRAELHDALIPFIVSEPSRNGGPAPMSGTLRFLPFGSGLAGSPADLVGSSAVADLLAELASSTEVVLVQAPPLLGVGDAIALSESVDGIVLLTDLSELDRKSLATVERMLDSTSKPVLGIVVLGTARTT